MVVVYLHKYEAADHYVDQKSATVLSGGFTFTGTNGWASQTITTVTSGVGVAGATQTLTAASTATTITEAVPAGYSLASATCSGIGAGTATLAGNVLTLNAAATAPGNVVACTFTNTKLPTITLTKISNGAVGGFTFTGTNGWASQTITTVTSGVGVAGATQTLTAASTATTITETVPAGYSLASATCSGIGAGTATLAGNVLTLNAAATAPGNVVACTFTNTKLPTITLTKISNGAVGGFTFTGTNGWASQTITTVTSGVGVAGATQTLTAASTATDDRRSGACRLQPGVGHLFWHRCRHTATLAGNVLTLNAAATAPGNAVACTFTNTKLPTITLTKISNRAVGGFCLHRHQWLGEPDYHHCDLRRWRCWCYTNTDSGFHGDHDHRSGACRLQPGVSHLFWHRCRHSHACRQCADLECGSDGSGQCGCLYLHQHKAADHHADQDQ